jgi:hypothetical protein
MEERDSSHGAQENAERINGEGSANLSHNPMTRDESGSELPSPMNKHEGQVQGVQEQRKKGSSSSDEGFVKVYQEDAGEQKPGRLKGRLNKKKENTPTQHIKQSQTAITYISVNPTSSNYNS